MGADATYFPNTYAKSAETQGAARELVPSTNISSSTAPQEHTPRNQLVFSDDLLLVQVATGDKDALAILFRRHSRVVYSVACRILRDEYEAEDLV